MQTFLPFPDFQRSAESLDSSTTTMLESDFALVTEELAIEEGKEALDKVIKEHNESVDAYERSLKIWRTVS